MPSSDVNDQTFATRDRPKLVVVDDHESSRRVVSNSIRRRFGLDYAVVEVSPGEVHAKLEDLHAAGADVALIVANQYLSPTRERSSWRRRDMSIPPHDASCSPTSATTG